jgi:hypothetical protein
VYPEAVVANGSARLERDARVDTTPLAALSLATRAKDSRRREPVTIGVPLPMGSCGSAAEIGITNETGCVQPVQTQVLEQWPDGSPRWVLIDCQLSSGCQYRLCRTTHRAAAADAIAIDDRAEYVSVDTGCAAFRVFKHGALLLQALGGSPRTIALVLAREDGPLTFEVVSAAVETKGCLRSSILQAGRFAGDSRLLVLVRTHFYAGLPTIRIDVTLRNERRARHRGGFWELGDAGSVLLREMRLDVRLPEPPAVVTCTWEPGETPRHLATPLQIYQDSSGGDHWDSTNHVNQHGVLPLRFRGYEVSSAFQVVHAGARATPLVWTGEGALQTAVALRHFWQNFPKALEVTGAAIAIGLLPRQAADLHELQGGEQTTHTVHIAFGADMVARCPLAWTLDPSVAAVDVEWYARAEAVPYLVPEHCDPHGTYVALVRSAIDGPDAIVHKREVIDEYGWRNFGDLYADHEATGDPAVPVVSHYNNQYDALYGFIVQFLRTGDLRWWDAMDELARHVLDIDLYHTTEDRPAYNGGLFWHTYHYTDAGRSTHRAYPRAPGVPGGGPSNEHLYSTGLLLHYFLTGSTASREAVLGLAEWVLAMDDGRRTPLRWLARVDTGYASSTRAWSYHGPGRGAANSLVALLNGLRLGGDARLRSKAEQLIRRCIHPADDIAGLGLLDAENRWSYVVFLQALGRYLWEKARCGELDAAYAYARASLLAYTCWMAEHEYPYLDRPERLEFPTETWAAHDMRKSEVFGYAALHAAGGDRDRFRERAAFFFERSLQQLMDSPTRTRTRPVVVLLSCGFAQAALDAASPLPPPVEPWHDAGPRERFLPQKMVALQRLRRLAAAAVLGTVAWLMTYLAR